MEQRISFITLGVKDLVLMKKFYTEKFGWKPFKDEDGIVFFRMNGFILALFPEHELAEDANVLNDGSGFRRFSLSINFSSEKEVDEVMADLRSKGISVTRPAEKVFWGGYRGYVSDPEGNLWEFAYNPFLQENMKPQ